MIDIDENIDDEAFFEISALLLSLNRKTFEAITSLKNFQIISKYFTLENIDNLVLLHKLQNAIINHFLEHRSKSSILHLHDSFTYLLDEGLMDKPSLEKLISLFDPSTFDECREEELAKEAIDENFNVQREEILLDLDKLSKIVENSDGLREIASYLGSQKFSIGVTGVMNSGKSTMLNALMGKEILGTSVVPETANLTVIKFSETPKAKVVYWSKEEWRRILKNADSVKEIASFVKETQNHFKDELDDYVLEKSREDVVNVNELSKYTSASLSDKKCNMIKYVELQSDLDFLQDGIEIVDTPGLDDVVVQREEITKEYLSRCDVMLHLMNVSQSATNKDVEFIIDAVLYQNVTKVLIVITRVDMVSAQDVKEVIAYTKESISRRLSEQNSDSKLDFVLKSLHFLALSAKMALLHKTAKTKEALDAGYSLEETGILELEEYVKETLFSSKNARGSLIIRSAKNRLRKLVSAQLDELRFENGLLFKTKDEVDEELGALKSKKNMRMETLKLLKEQIGGYELEITEYLKKLQYFLDDELKKLQTVIKQRLVDETKYHLQNGKKTPPLSDVSRIIDTAIKNGVVDVVREYRYKFIQKSSKIYEAITLQYDILETNFEEGKKAFNGENSFADEFNKGFLTFGSSTFIANAFKLLSGATLSKLQTTDAQLDELIKDELTYLQTRVKEKALSLSKTLLEEFFVTLKEPISLFQNALERNEQLLQNHVSLVKEDESSRREKSLELGKKIKSLELIAKRYAA